MTFNDDKFLRNDAAPQLKGRHDYRGGEREAKPYRVGLGKYLMVAA